MLGKIAAMLGICCACLAPPAGAFDVNQADEADLRAIKGMGPAKTRALLEERRANGPFADERDLAARVTGIGPKMVARMRSEGMTFGSGPAAARPPVAAGSSSRGAGGASPPLTVKRCPLSPLSATPTPRHSVRVDHAGYAAHAARTIPTF